MASRSAHARNLFGAALRSLYRIRVEGAANIPAEGPVLVVADEDALLAGPLLKASLPRPASVLAPTGGVVPPQAASLAGDLPEGHFGIAGALASLTALREGQAVVVLAPGPMSGLLAAASGAALVPAALWGASGRVPTDPPPPGRRIGVRFGPALGSRTPVAAPSWPRCLEEAERLRQAIVDLRGNVGRQGE